MSLETFKAGLNTLLQERQIYLLLVTFTFFEQVVSYSFCTIVALFPSRQSIHHCGQTCAICLEAPEDPVTLPCNHAYCARCVAALRERHVKQVCPLCREPLAQGQGASSSSSNGGGSGGSGLGDDLYDEATRLFVPVQRAVERGPRGRAPGGWGRLPRALQADVDRYECVGVRVVACGHVVVCVSPLFWKRADVIS